MVVGLMVQVSLALKFCCVKSNRRCDQIRLPASDSILLPLLRK